MIKRVQVGFNITGSWVNITGPWIPGYIQKNYGLGHIEVKENTFFLPLKWHFIGLNFLSQIHRLITNNPQITNSPHPKMET